MKTQPYPVAREGFPFIFAALILFIFSIYYFPQFKYFFLILFLFITYFFRNPSRTIPQLQNAILSPADGTVLKIEEVEEKRYLNKRVIKVSIFLSVFNVHLNRIPVPGIIKKIVYHPGKFFVASFDKASTDNEQNAILVETSQKKEVVFVQIAGLIARRIVSYLKEGDVVTSGTIFGLIRFGSRMDLYLPLGTEIRIKPKDKVKGGMSILGVLK